MYILLYLYTRNVMYKRVCVCVYDLYIHVYYIYYIQSCSRPLSIISH